MSNIVVLNSQSHRHLKVQAGPSAALGERHRYVSVVISEIPFLVPHYPVFFSKDQETGAFFCGALLGIDDGENLFLDDPAGLDSYRPLNLQRGPFSTIGTDLAIDLDHPRVGTDLGSALFGEAGEPTPYLETVVSTIQELRQGLAATQQFIARLVELRLIEAIDLDLDFDDGVKRELRGLYTIDKEALARLPDADVLELFRRGFLNVVYQMIVSLKQVRVLAQKKNRRLAE